MAKSFWSFFALYDGEVKCQTCKKVQVLPRLDQHEPDCSSSEEALKWFSEVSKKDNPQPQNPQSEE